MCSERQRFLEEADQGTAEEVQRYLCNKGACFITKRTPVAINVALLPTPISKPCYQHLIASQKPLNTLIDVASRDSEFVISSVEPSVDVDYLAKRLLEIYKLCFDADDQITLGSYRNDYIYHCPGDPKAPGAVTSGVFKMVEANLMSAALLGIGTHTMDLHNQLMGRHMSGREQPYQRSLPTMMEGYYEAYKLYNQPGSIVLFLVHPDDFNWFDQQHMIDYLWEEYGIVSIKMTFDEFMVEGEMIDKRYYVRGYEVAIFYFRSMYHAAHYKTEGHWTTRLKMEKSLAIKVPNIRHQVMNLKLFQQTLLNEGVMEKYVGKEDAVLVRSTFAELHNLTPGPQGDKAAQLAFQDKFGWVLKPSKEGGGNNVWEDDMLQLLTDLKDSNERSAFVLMQRLKAPHVPNRFVKNAPHSEPELTEIFDTTTELGLFCVYVADRDGKEVFNEVGGPLLRSKPAQVNEGGIAIGVGVMDSGYFVK